MYAAAAADDEAGMKAVFAPDFYAFDNGKRFSGAELANLVKASHAAGRTYVWTVQEPKVTFACDWAFIAYTNRGSMKDASGEHPLTWLESAVLQWRDGRWRIHFFHSTRAAPEPAKGG